MSLMRSVPEATCLSAQSVTLDVELCPKAVDALKPKSRPRMLSIAAPGALASFSRGRPMWPCKTSILLMLE